MYNRTALLVFITLVMVVTTAATTFYRSGQEQASTPRGQEENRDKHRIEFEKRFPVVDFDKPEPADPEKLKLRKNKNSRYDKFGFAVKDSTPRVDEESFESDWALATEALPVSKSTAIIVGEVLAAEAHISNDKTGIYSEFAFRIEQVLMDDGFGQLKPGRSVTVDRAGGIVTYPNGHRRLYRVVGQNMPRIGQRYLLFLKDDDESPNYNIITGYELGGAGVSPLDMSSRMDAYKGTDEASFLVTVRDAITSRTVNE